jgi:hypothetical protein
MERDSSVVKLYEPSRGDVRSPFIGDVLRPSLDRSTLDPNSSVVKLYEPSRGDVRSPFVGDVLRPRLDRNILDLNSDLETSAGSRYEYELARMDELNVKRHSMMEGKTPRKSFGQAVFCVSRDAELVCVYTELPVEKIGELPVEKIDELPVEKKGELPVEKMVNYLWRK